MCSPGLSHGIADLTPDGAILILQPYDIRSLSMTDSFTLCATCGVEHGLPLPDVCAICDDDRQYLPPDGVQRWVTMEDLQTDRTTSV